MNKRKRMAALFLAVVMVFATAFTGSPVSVSAAKKKVTVKSVTTKSSLSGNKKTLYVAKGKTVKLSTTVNVKPGKAANKKVTYKSANSKIASVSAKGAVKGVKPGSTKITVTSKKNTKKKATIKVKVTKQPVKKITISQKSATLEKGAGLTLKAKVTAKKGAVKTVGWKSSNEKVAKVSSKGAVTAVGAGKATITAQAIDGSGKKATCKVTVNDSVNLTSMNILNSYTISFSLNKACALKASQVVVKCKTMANGVYRGNLKVESLSTNNNVNYTLILENGRSIGDYIQISIPSLNGTVKAMEKQYLEPAYAFTGGEVLRGYVGEEFYDELDFSYIGYSDCSISNVPAGLKAEVVGSSIELSGKPTRAGMTKAVFRAIDEMGNTMTKDVYFIIGSDTAMVGAFVPRYYLSSNDSYVYANPSVVGGSGYYSYQIISGQNSGASIDADDDLYMPLKVAGTYTVTVRVTDRMNTKLFCDVPMVFHVAQGVSIGGCIKDAQGNPMKEGYVSFRNKNRADRYFTSGSFYVDETTGVYSAVVAPGTYDLQARYSRSSEAASATYYAQNQVLTASRTGYDFTLPLYKVSLVTGDKNISLNRNWYINDEDAGYGSILYLKAGAYTLESSDDSEGTTTSSGNWFNGTTYTTTYTPVKYRASVNIVNAAVQAGVVKTAGGAPTTYTHTYPAAKATNVILEIDAEDSYDLPYVYDDDYEEELYTALKVNVAADGSYRLYSSFDNVNLYDTDGNVVTSDDYDYMTYELKAGTYYIGTGDYYTSDYNISMTTVTESAE